MLGSAPAAAHGTSHHRTQRQHSSRVQPGATIVQIAARHRRQRKPSWPLPERAFQSTSMAHSDLQHSRSREVYAVDLLNGRVALVGLTRHRDSRGWTSTVSSFATTSSSAARASLPTLMKFIPRRHIEAALQPVGKPLRVPGEIADLAVDGSRVALAVRRWQGGCDAVIYWNTPWNYAIPITEDDERRVPGHGTADDSVRLAAGLRAAWVMRVGSQDRLVSASSVDCFERRSSLRIPRSATDSRRAGDAGLLAYLVTVRVATSSGS